MDSSDVPARRLIAMLVDGENCGPTLLASMFAETAKQGEVTIRRVYGDWTRPSMANWKQPLQKLAFQPIQQFHHTAGKNGTDCAMIVDAMDILYGGRVNGFCLGSSDSDFTRLAIRIREQGHFVMGIGSTNTPSVLVAACDKFVFLPSQSKKQSKEPVDASIPMTPRLSAGKPDPLPLLEAVFANLEIGGGWVDISVIGGHLRRIDPQFRPQVYGYRQLNLMCRDQSNIFEVRQQGSTYQIRVRPGHSLGMPRRIEEEEGKTEDNKRDEQPAAKKEQVLSESTSQLLVSYPPTNGRLLARQPALFDCDLSDPSGELRAGTSANRAVNE
jgi:hypothetical protein